jgi:hypothetical protein
MTPWHCPWRGCDRLLTECRVVAWGCCGIVQPVGYCPWHRDVVPALSPEERRRVLLAAAPRPPAPPGGAA